MNTNQIFNRDFVDQVRNVLSERCVDGAAVTRSQLCQILGIPVPSDKDKRMVLENTVGSLITLGAVEGYEMRHGRFGGIGKTGERPAKTEKGKRSKTVNPSRVSFPEGFIEAAQSKLDELSADGSSVTRRKLAEAMGQPGSDTENLISKAFKAGYFEGYTTKIGANGGFMRVGAVEDTASSDNSSDSENSEENASE